MLILISCPCLARIFLINGRDRDHHKLCSGDTITSPWASTSSRNCISLRNQQSLQEFWGNILKTSRTVWVITWWVEESWCLRLHKVGCCYDLHSLKWKPWVIQLKPGSGGSSSSRRGQFLLTNLFDYLHETETAAVKTRRAEEENSEHGTHQQYLWWYHAYLEWNIFIIPYILYLSDILNTDWGELEI